MSHDDYLWDASGEPEPEVRRLEELLRPLRGPRAAPDFARLAPSKACLSHPMPLPTLAAAAAVILALAATWGGLRPRDAGWELAWFEGPSGSLTRQDRLRVGEWLETGAQARARLRVGAIGEVELEPRTRLRLLDTGGRAHRLALQRGVIHAWIWAPPGTFVVDTPSAIAVDLGCRYTLEVDAAGSGLLRVVSGWVGFEHQGRESFVPAGALCATRLGIGPGTPYYTESGAAFRAALEAVDFAPESGARSAALEQVLAEAQPRDALSLWHLLGRLEGHARGLVFDRLAALVPPPLGVTRAGILQGDRAMRDLWWNELGLGTAEFWRIWKGRWPPRAR